MDVNDLINLLGTLPSYEAENLIEEILNLPCVRNLNIKEEIIELGVRDNNQRVEERVEELSDEEVFKKYTEHCDSSLYDLLSVFDYEEQIKEQEIDIDELILREQMEEEEARKTKSQ